MQGGRVCHLFGPLHNYPFSETKQVAGLTSTSSLASQEPFTFGNRMLIPPTEPEECYLPKCKRIGAHRCSRCKAWYCSLKCQSNHWQKHREDCQPPPPLENIDGYVAVVNLVLCQMSASSKSE